MTDRVTTAVRGIAWMFWVGAAVCGLAVPCGEAAETETGTTVVADNELAPEKNAEAKKEGKPLGSKETNPLLRDTPKPEPVSPPQPEQIAVSIKKGVGFLLSVQNKDGSWGSARRTKDLNIYAPIPGSHQAFRAAVTSLVICALIEAGDLNDPAVLAALERGENYLLENLSHVRRANQDALYNVWTHGYSLQAMVRMYKRHSNDEDRRKKIRELIALQFDLLDRYESVDGGWGYYDFRVHAKKPSTDSISFTTATILIAFHECKQSGFEPPRKLVDRGVASIQRQLRPDFAYLYGEYLKNSPALGINGPGGSLGRSQACNMALKLWGDERITEDVFTVWLDRLVARNGWLDIGRKRPIPHESYFQVAGYFFYYGHYYAAYCIEAIPAEKRPVFQDHLATLIMNLQEKDGSWWDYPFYDYHQPYGTAFALMTLARCPHGVKAPLFEP